MSRNIKNMYHGISEASKNSEKLNQLGKKTSFVLKETISVYQDINKVREKLYDIPNQMSRDVSKAIKTIDIASVNLIDFPNKLDTIYQEINNLKNVFYQNISNIQGEIYSITERSKTIGQNIQEISKDINLMGKNIMSVYREKNFEDIRKDIELNYYDEIYNQWNLIEISDQGINDIEIVLKDENEDWEIFNNTNQNDLKNSKTSDKI